jgi:hypothetical protein
MVTRLHTGDAFTNFNDDTGSPWPRTTGKTPSGSFPERVKASVWQTPVWVFLISTSPFLGGATSISTISRGFLVQMQQRHVISYVIYPQCNNGLTYLR